MNINLTKLKTGLEDKIVIDNTIDIPKKLLQGTEINDISEIKVVGEIFSHDSDNFEINLNIKCNLVLTCSISLKPVDYNIDIEINDIIGENDENLEENNKIINNTIDLIPIIWQNIILEVPLKVISPDVTPENISGDGWRFITDEKDIKKEIDPRLEGLKKFLDE